MKIRNSLLSLLLVMTLVFGLMPMAVAADATTFPDMPADGYWSTEALKNAVANGILQGTPEGKILPKAPLTRAQMATVMARAFGATVKGDLSGFKDVAPLAWYTDAIAQAYQMGILQGTGTKMNPNANITRQEVFTIVARAFKLQPADTISKTFSDTDQIASWAKGSIYALVNAGYIEGSNGKLNPKGLITREEFATVFDRLLEQYIKEAGVVTEVAKGNVMINAPGVTLKNLTVSGDLIIGDGVGDGDVILENVTVKGRLVVRGGGVNSIVIRGTSNIGNVIVARVDGAVSVKVLDGAEVEVIYIDDGSDDVVIQGTIGALEIAASDVTVTASGAKIGTATVVGQNTNLIVDEKSTITTLNVKDDAENTDIEVKGTVSTVTTAGTNTSISGTGTVTTVVAASGSSGTKVETPKTQIVAQAGSSDVTGGGGKAVDPGTTATNNNDGTDITPPPAGGGGYVPPSKTLYIGVSTDGIDEAFEMQYNAGDNFRTALANALNDNFFQNAVYVARLKARDKDIIDSNGLILPLSYGTDKTLNLIDLLSDIQDQLNEKLTTVFDSDTCDEYFAKTDFSNYITDGKLKGASDLHTAFKDSVLASYDLIANGTPVGMTESEFVNLISSKLAAEYSLVNENIIPDDATPNFEAIVEAMRNSTLTMGRLNELLGSDFFIITITPDMFDNLEEKLVEIPGTGFSSTDIEEIITALQSRFDFMVSFFISFTGVLPT